ncbi:MAG: DUF2807 domain-containing protein [Flavobacteriales bacterium]|nr:DUF2807 domain-containing protein [Flavobacteriales bacterium]
MKTLALAAALALLTTGCNINCIKGSGPVEERTLVVASFTGIEVGGSTRVTIEKGAEQKITVTAQPELIDLLNTEVKGDVWDIRTSQCWISDAEFTVHIVTPSLLNSIEVHGSSDVLSDDVFGTGHTDPSTGGSGSITISGINEKELELGISGSGTITVRGTCSELDASLSGSGDLHGKELTANEADLKVSGSGSATITAISKLNAKVSGSGEVRYAGKPDVRSSVSGSGSVTPVQ